jgi:uncharacterized membrane protein YkoI
MSRTKKLIPGWVAVSAVTIGLLGGGYGVAAAATGKGATKKATRAAAKPGAQRAEETPLTGDTLAKVSAAALAKVPGGKVVRAETDGDGNAAYEAHMTNASGAPVTVYVDKDFAVVSVDTSTRGGGGKGRHGGARSDETPLTGDTLAKASAAALAKVPGGKVVRAETDADGNALYEVHMTNASGAPVTVHLDKDFGVVSVENGR